MTVLSVSGTYKVLKLRLKFVLCRNTWSLNKKCLLFCCQR